VGGKEGGKKDGREGGREEGGMKMVSGGRRRKERGMEGERKRDERNDGG
jgi:hypothetical protein